MSSSRETSRFALCAAAHALAIVMVSGCAQLRDVAEGAAIPHRVAALIEPLLAANEFSGAIVLTQRGRTVYQGAFGNANADLPFTVDTAADGGSIAKTFTAAGIWWLVAEGRIDPDATVATYVSAYPHRQTTVRHLLAHSGGLTPDYGEFAPSFAAGEPWTTEKMLDVIGRSGAAPRFDPGSRFEYSSLGYDVLALVIESASGRTYEHFLDERFLSPLRMRSTFVRPARFSDWPSARTIGRRYREGKWETFDVTDREGFRGGSNLYVSARDLSRWAAGHAAGRAMPATANALARQPALISGRPSGLSAASWYCDAFHVRCHYTGDLKAFYSLAWWDRERNESVVFVSNSAMPAWKRAWLGRALIDVLRGATVTSIDSPEFGRFTRATRGAVAGIYTAGNVRIAVGTAQDRLSMRVGDGPEYQVFQVSREIFYVPGLDDFLAFGPGSPPSTLVIRNVGGDRLLRRDDR